MIGAARGLAHADRTCSTGLTLATSLSLAFVVVAIVDRASAEARDARLGLGWTERVAINMPNSAAGDDTGNLRHLSTELPCPQQRPHGPVVIRPRAVPEGQVAVRPKVEPAIGGPLVPVKVVQCRRESAWPPPRAPARPEGTCGGRRESRPGCRETDREARFASTC